jgi:hypothetical protein
MSILFSPTIVMGQFAEVESIFNIHAHDLMQLQWAVSPDDPVRKWY